MVKIDAKNTHWSLITDAAAVNPTPDLSVSENTISSPNPHMVM